MHALKRLSMAIVMLLPALTMADVVVSHFEALQKTVVAPAKLQFEALGRSFDLQLETNERVIAGLSAAQRPVGLGVYRGRLANNPDSWVRVVVYAGMPRGVIWDGVEMYAIEAPGDGQLASTSPVVYRLADAYIEPGTMQCSDGSLAGNSATVWTQLAAANKTALALAPGAVSEISMSAIGDYEFTSAKGGDATATVAIATRLNNVDGFFSEQLGVQINVQLIETHASAADPFGDTLVADNLLSELSEYRLQTPAHKARGLTHLYTGRNLDTTTVGIAWRGTLCDDYFGAGLSQSGNDPFVDSLIAAHEIGHNFGAQHDGEAGSPCAAETGQFIMSPSINGSQQFSACSIGIMQNEAAAASCVAALPTVDVSIALQNPVASMLLGASNEFVYTIASNGTVDVAAVSAEFTLPDNLTLDAVTASVGSCTSGAGIVSCALGDLPGLSSQSIALTATANAVGPGALLALVRTTDTDERPANNQETLQLVVDPAVNLAVEALNTAPVFVNDSTTVTATLANRSSLAATSVVLSATLEAGLQATAASWTLGSCTVAAQQIDCQANAFAAQGSSAFSITATGITAGRRDVTVTLASAEAEAVPGDNSAVAVVQVVAPKDKNDSGGGAANPLALLLLAAAAAARRRRERPGPQSALAEST